ncbi:helix-turn-helix domain-containing protein [Sphingomonas sp. MG17]|jgi:cytoskeletal protein RodZ|uniref:Helix-turn-helix domain-containing protein n=1 Tax=Sphingomonas tagetis TaxID=2949092 RepID=A0A9X2HIH0_9SPHN|nr:helix-turn-helix domain-containing protein [Sphingomonas tagetis]MCP3730237.1 helix-turn-helix domain-containing protein [Sphingomonas tagetis]
MNAMIEHPILPFAQDEWRVEPRGSLGEALTEARLRCAMSIEDVAAETRVPVRYLAAIEAERFDLIPALVYIKGFVRAFARAVGLCERWATEAVKAVLADRRGDRRVTAAA